MSKQWVSDGLVEWCEGENAFLSVVFSWNLPDAYQRAVWLRAEGKTVHAGGPAVALNPEYLADVANVNGVQVDALPRHNPHATFTSRGCIRRCSFCAVPKIEGDLRELNDWEPRPVVCDNNLLACSVAHFDRVIDRLKPLRGMDFQGLDARLLTKHHAERLTELNLCVVRLAWDNTRAERDFRRAWDLLHDAGVPATKIRVYVLLGFDDTPEDALYRLQTVKDMGSWPNPMRYQPLNAVKRNEHIAPGWTDRELKRFMRYWSRLAWLEHVPFSEYQMSRR